MNPTNGQNPYLQLLGQMQGGQSAGIGGPMGPAGGGGRGMSPTGQPAVQGGVPGGAPQQAGAQGQQMPQAGGQTKLLVSALQAIDNFGKQVPDPQEAALARSIVTLLAGLIQRDQARQTQGPQGLPQQANPQTPGPGMAIGGR